MNHPILLENQKLRLNIRLPLLCCFAMFSAWQMAVVYYSGTTLSVDGRTPLPVDVGNITWIVAAGYILSILYMIFLPHFVVWAERVTAALALVSMLGMFLPLSPAALTNIFYFHAFCCVFMIGFETAIIVNLFAEKTAITFLLVGYACSYAIVAVLQNDWIAMPFSIFQVFTIVALMLMLVFFWSLPAKAWPRYAKKSDGLVCPRRLFAGIFALATLSFMILVSSAVAENVIHGVSVYYLSMTVCGLVVYFLWKLLDISPLRSASVLVVLGALGFVAAIVSLHLPALAYLACVLLGSGFVALCLIPFFGVVLMGRYPSRFVAPGFISIALCMLMLHSALLEAFRDNTQMLYVVYLVISVVLTIVYLMLEPYLIYSFRGRSLVSEATGAVEDSVSHKAQSLRAAAFDALTDTELMIAERVLRGYSNKEIGAELGYSESTIKTYRKNLYSKLQIHSPRELFLLAEKGYPDRKGGGGA